jgi:hypothetical protein
MVVLAADAAAGEIAAAEKKWEDAITHLEKAVNPEDELRYAEPPPWHYPMRHSLGAVASARQRGYKKARGKT